ncbi:MAG TPA: hypothetical protein VGD67_04835 [Pseudonocardiaceae bacterium]
MVAEFEGQPVVGADNPRVPDVRSSLFTGMPLGTSHVVGGHHDNSSRSDAAGDTGRWDAAQAFHHLPVRTSRAVEER